MSTYQKLTGVPNLAISPATEADLAELAAVIDRAEEGNPLHGLVYGFGHRAGDDLARAHIQLARLYQMQDPQARFFKATMPAPSGTNQRGPIVGFGSFKFHPEEVPEYKDPDYHTAEQNRNLSSYVARETTRQHRQYVSGQKHVGAFDISVFL